MIDAMACGTPVIAVIRQVPRLCHAQVRARFEERFTACRLTEEYLAVYRDLAAERRGAPLRAAPALRRAQHAPKADQSQVQ